MQLRSKLLFGLLATVLVMGMMAPMADAQISLTLNANGSSEEVRSNQNALTDDRDSLNSGITVTGQLLATSVLTETNIVINYPGPITSNAAAAQSANNADLPTADPIRIASASSLFASITIGTIDYEDGEIFIVLPGTTPGSTNSLSGSFLLAGVRIDPTGLTAPVSASVSLSNSANNYQLGTTSLEVISNLSQAVSGISIGTATGAGTAGNGLAILFTDGTIGDSLATILIQEGFSGGLKTDTQESHSGTALGFDGTQIELTFSTPPAGVNLSLAIGDVHEDGAIAGTFSNSVITDSSRSLSGIRGLQPRINNLQTRDGS